MVLWPCGVVRKISKDLLTFRKVPVERDDKPWNVESISDKNPFPVEGNDGGARAKDGNKGIVAHANLEIGHGLV
jgi:hypothetical protein